MTWVFSCYTKKITIATTIYWSFLCILEHLFWIKVAQSVVSESEHSSHLHFLVVLCNQGVQPFQTLLKVLARFAKLCNAYRIYSWLNTLQYHVAECINRVCKQTNIPMPAMSSWFFSNTCCSWWHRSWLSACHKLWDIPFLQWTDVVCLGLTQNSSKSSWLLGFFDSFPGVAACFSNAILQN